MPRLSLSVSMVCMVLTLMIIPPTSGKSLGAAGLVIGTTKITIDHAWRRDGGPCVGGICGYKTWFQKGLWVEVSYNKQNRADGYQFDFDPDLYLGQPLS
ncbi:MAG TPA: hypothetical protein VF221_23615, partial [Chloroflexota bacterium]